MKRYLAIAAAVAVLASCSRVEVKNPLPREKSEAVEAAVEAYVNEAAALKIPINTIIVIQHGKVLGEAYVNGWTPTRPHHMWSTTKTFTSMAVGLAVDEGKLSLGDRMADIFPEQAAAVLDTLKDGTMREYLCSGTVKDFLVMSAGHDRDVLIAICDKYSFPYWIDDHGKRIDRAFASKDVDIIEEFFAHPYVYEPGTHNFYDNEGSHMLSCAVQKKTGEKVSDYLATRLFEPLGIERPFWDEIQGCSSGGWGLYIIPEDMAKFGLCLLNGGEFGGKQVLPRWYVEEASRRYFSWNAPSGVPAEEGRSYFQGYGYQMWMNSNAFCCAGARGQFICMLPEYDAVITATAQVRGDDHTEMALLWKHILPVLAEGK